MTQDKDVRIAELEAENERLRNMLNGYGKLDAELAIAERRIEDLSRTGAVKVKPLDLSNLLRHAFFEGFMVAGGSQEAAAEWWPEYDPETCAAYSRILSALELAAPEGRQEPVAWGLFYRGKIVAVSLHEHYRYTVPLYTRPSEQAVTDAMVEAVRKLILDDVDVWLSDDTIRGALKAAMEAGR